MPQRSLIINYDFNQDFAIVSPVRRCDLGRFNHLLEFLYNQWRNERHLDELCRKAIARTAILFPRIDIKGNGFDTELLSDRSLEELFLGQLEEDKLLPSKLMLLHHFEPPKKKNKKPKEPGESLTPDDIPIPSSGLDDADTLASLIAIDDSIGGAIQLWESLDAQMISCLIFHLNELRRDPKDRLNEYLNDYLERWKQENQQTYHDAIFG